jgi:hypothetical protein
MTPARQRRQRSAWMTDADLTPIPYLGTGLVTAEPVSRRGSSVSATGGT